MDIFQKIIGKSIYFIDFETNGLHKEPVEVGIYSPFDESKCYNQIIYTPNKIDKEAQKIHNIPTKKIRAGMKKSIVFNRIKKIIEPGSVLIAHNCNYEKAILEKEFDSSVVSKWKYGCTWLYAKSIHKRYNAFDALPKNQYGTAKLSLNSLTTHYGVGTVQHRAFDDAVKCYEIMKRLILHDKDLTMVIISDHIFLKQIKPKMPRIRAIKTKKGSDNGKNISDYMKEINTYLETNLGDIKLECEVVNCKQYSYITYLDLSDDTGIMNGILKGKNNKGEPIKIGDKIKIEGSICIYASKSANRLQVDITKYSKLGTGDKYSDLIKLTTKLKDEGLFNRKRPIKSNYSKIGLITSLQAAGLKDMLATIRNRLVGGEIVIYDSVMQGDKAPKSIIESIKLANKHKYVDVLAIARGGGGKEDLWCFNDEQLARVIFESKIPTVTGIGHDIDRSIADMVSDKEFITPTAVAEGITSDKNTIMAELEQCNKYIAYYLQKTYGHNKALVENMHNSFNDKIVGVLSTFKNEMLNIRSQFERSLIAEYDITKSKVINLNLQLAKSDPCTQIARTRLDLDGFKIGISKVMNNIINSHMENIDGMKENMIPYDAQYKSCTIVVGKKLIKSTKQLAKYKDKKIKLLFDDGYAYVTIDSIKTK
jgi:exodeoxyribonuclease VII large subunit